MNNLDLPVVVTDINDHEITFKAQASIMQCPKCAQGEGCGAYPWFQGFLFKQSLSYTLPLEQALPDAFLAIDEPATLQIDRATMNGLSVLTYGLALLGFMLGLSLAVFGINEGGQILAAIVGLIAGIMLSKPLTKYYLSRHLRIVKSWPDVVMVYDNRN